MTHPDAVGPAVFLEIVILFYYVFAMTFGSFRELLLKLLGVWYMAFCSMFGCVLGCVLAFIFIGDTAIDQFKDQAVWVSHFSAALEDLTVFGPNKRALAFMIVAVTMPFMLGIDILWNTFILCFYTASWPFTLMWTVFMLVGMITAMDWANKIRMFWGLLSK